MTYQLSRIESDKKSNFDRLKTTKIWGKIQKNGALGDLIYVTRTIDFCNFIIHF